MTLTRDTLNLAYMALNAKVAKYDSYPPGSMGSELGKEYCAALNEINELIAETTTTPSSTG